MQTDERTAGYLLSKYPTLWVRMQNQRETILHAYHASGDYQLCGGRTGHGDPTGKRAALLIENEEENRLTMQVGQWIDQELRPEDRRLLLHVWSESTWRYIKKHEGGTKWQCVTRWETMKKSLLMYLMRCAGRACGVSGVASVNIHQIYTTG